MKIEVELLISVKKTTDKGDIYKLRPELRQCAEIVDKELLKDLPHKCRENNIKLVMKLYQQLISHKYTNLPTQYELYSKLGII
jgi:hypothetical protein